MTWQEWLYAAALFVVGGDGLYWWRRALRAEAEAQKWRAAADHARLKLGAKALLADAEERTAH